jgi:hypothetical protein
MKAWYARMMRKGKIYIRPPEERFLERFSPSAPNECWEWQGHKTTKGYGMLRLGAAKRNIYAHRYAYMRCHGVSLPPGISHIVMHTCDNPSCVNPAHLRLGTQNDNCLDKMAKGRHPRIRNYGSRSGTAKLTEELIPLIRKRISNGERQTQIAKELGVTATCINSVSRGRTWAHVR